MTAALAYVAWTAYALLALVIIRSPRISRRWQSVSLAVLAVTSAFTFAVVSWGRATPFGDFNKAYYPAGQLALADPTRLYECGVSNLCFVNVPIVAVLFAPLGAMDLRTAQITFTAIGVIAVLVSAWMLARAFELKGSQRDILLALFALNGPLFYSARLGNVSHVMLPLLAFLFFALARQREVAGGVALAIVTVLKPPFLLFAPYLLARQRWRAFLAFALTMAIVVMLSVAWFGSELHAVWLREFAGPFSRRPVAAYNSQSLSAMLARFVYPYNLLNWEPLLVAPAIDVLRNLLVGGVAVLTAVWAFLSGPPRTDLARWHELGLVLVVAMLAAPVTWTHYYAFCLVPLAALLAGMPGRSRRMNAATALATVLLSLPVVLAIPEQPVLRGVYERLIASHYAFGALLLLAAIGCERWERSPAAHKSGNIAGAQARYGVQ